MTTSLIDHKKARFNYEIQEELEAGIELFGHEVKSIKGKQGSLEGSHVTIRGGEAFLVNASVPAYQAKNTPLEYNPERIRKLLLTKAEIQKLATIEQERGLTIVPISMYNKGRVIKVRIAIARGKKKSDKRETIKKREDERSVRRTLKYE